MTVANRAENLKTILDYVRDYDDSRLEYGYRGDDLMPLMAWLRKMDTVTLNEAVKTYVSPEPKHRNILPSAPRAGAWGSGVDFLISASKEGLDDTTVSLGLFAASIINPMPRGPQVLPSGKTNDIPFVYWESMEYVSGLYDTLRYHPDSVPAECYSLLMDGNILSVSSDGKDRLAALLTVTDRIVQHGLEDEFCAIGDSYQREGPHRAYMGFNTNGTIWLRNGKLVKYVLDNSDNASVIADVIVARKSDDPEIISMVLEQETKSLSSGVL